MRVKALAITCVALAIGGSAFAAGCSDDDNNNNNNQDSGLADTAPPNGDGGAEGGPCKFNDFVQGLITNSTTPTALPSTDLGDNCTDDMTPFPATTFQ